MVRDAAEVVKVAQRVQVTVTEVDFPRKRIALSLKSKPDFEKKVGNTGPRPPGCGDSGDWFTVGAQKGRK